MRGECEGGGEEEGEGGRGRKGGREGERTEGEVTLTGVDRQVDGD